MDAKSKKEQVKLLHGQTINPDQLIAFIFKAWENGFSFSQYTSEHHHKGLDESKLPKLFKMKDGKVDNEAEGLMIPVRLSIIRRSFSSFFPLACSISLTSP